MAQHVQSFSTTVVVSSIRLLLWVAYVVFTGLRLVELTAVRRSIWSYFLESTLRQRYRPVAFTFTTFVFGSLLIGLWTEACRFAVNVLVTCLVTRGLLVVGLRHPERISLSRSGRLRGSFIAGSLRRQYVWAVNDFDEQRYFKAVISHDAVGGYSSLLVRFLFFGVVLLDLDEPAEFSQIVLEIQVGLHQLFLDKLQQ